MRRVARENLFKLVFEYTFYGVKNDDTLELMLLADDLSDEDRQYIKDAYNGIADNFDDLKDVISHNLQGYTVDRLYRPDFAVLIVAVYELERQTADDAVVINEAVELAKKYGTDNSGGFVNGVLARIVKVLRG